MAILAARVTRTPLAAILGSMPVLLKYLREFEAKQASASAAQGDTGGPMTREEAALILGVSENAPEDAIADAHRRLIQKNHPDLGGTDYLAAKINQARDVLLK